MTGKDGWLVLWVRQLRRVAAVFLAVAAAVAGSLLLAETIELRGHTSSVTAMEFGPDGALIATGSVDETVRIWDSRSGDELARLRGHEGQINAIAFDPDGTRVVTAGQDGTARLWDVQSGNELLRLVFSSSNYPRAVDTVDFSPDGRLIATGNQVGDAIIWDAATGEQVRRLVGHTSVVSHVKFSTDGTQLATGSYKTFRVWDVRRGVLVRDPWESARRVEGISYSPDGTEVVLSLGTIKVVMDALSNEEKYQIRGGGDTVFFSPFGRWLYSKDLIFDMERQEAVHRFGALFPEGTTDWLSRYYMSDPMAVDPLGARIATDGFGGNSDSVFIRDLPDEFRETLNDAPSAPAPERPSAPAAQVEEPVAPISPRTDLLALVIGNRTYGGRVPAVAYADRDAAAVAAFLTKNMGVPEDQVRVLSDLSFGQFIAWFGAPGAGGYLHAQIPSHIREVLVFYSGHGVPGPGPEGEPTAYLLPVDADPNIPQYAAYPLDRLLENLAGLPVEKVHLVLDACFSGQTPAGTLQTGTSGTFGSVVAEPEVPALVSILSATGFGDVQVAHWLDEERHGAFTWHFLQGLGGAADLDADAEITLTEVETYVGDRLKADAFAGRIGTQAPTLRLGGPADTSLVRFEAD